MMIKRGHRQYVMVRSDTVNKLKYFLNGDLTLSFYLKKIIGFLYLPFSSFWPLRPGPRKESQPETRLILTGPAPAVQGGS